MNIAGVTKYFEPGWKLTQGSFLNVEYWTSGAFSPLKIETECRLKYTRGYFSTALLIHFFLIFYYPDTLIDWLIIYCFTSRSRIFHLYGDVTIAGEWLQNLGLCSALMAFEQGGIFIVPHLLWHGALVFPVSSEGPPHSIASYDTRGDVEELFSPGSSRRVEYWPCWILTPDYRVLNSSYSTNNSPCY
jgi:hypothetical protein